MKQEILILYGAHSRWVVVQVVVVAVVVAAVVVVVVVVVLLAFGKRFLK